MDVGDIGLTRIFHTDRDEEAAKADGVRRTQHCDAGLYVSMLTRLAKLGSPLRAAPNLMVTAVYPRLSRALVLSKSQCEFNARSTLASRSPQVIGVKYPG